MGISRFPGELKHYEGTTAQCDGEQEVREIFFDSNSNELRYKKADSSIVYIGNENHNHGLGTSGYMAKYITSSGVGNSIIYEFGNLIGIGVAPTQKLHVNGNVMIPSGDVYYMGSANHYIGETGGNIRIITPGNVGIGTASPQERLTIKGSADISTEPFKIRNASNVEKLSFELDASGKSLITLDAGTPSTGVKINTGGISYLNGGNVGIGTTNPLDKLDVKGNIRASGTIITPSGMMTPEGGYAVRLYNYTGSTSVVGQIIEASGYLGFKTADANDIMPIGIVYEAVANAALCWVVVAGIANVLIDAGGCNIGDWIGTGATAGSADGDATTPAATQHFQECGHALETRVGAGLARCIIHFN